MWQKSFVYIHSFAVCECLSAGEVILAHRSWGPAIAGIYKNKVNNFRLK